MARLHELMSLKGRRALITGATGGLGYAISDTLAELGAALVIVDRPGSNLNGVSEALSGRWSVDVVELHCDLEQEEQRLALIENVMKPGGDLSILVNNAAFVGTAELEGWSVPFEVQTIGSWRRAIEVNLTAAFDLCQGFVPTLRSAAGGNIINIASIYGEYGPDWRLYEGTDMASPAAYAASKGGLIQLTRWLATTLAPDVRVNCISPGGIRRNQPKSFTSSYESRTPLRRMATEDDLRGAVAYLASDLSRYVTGQTLRVDGGWGVW